LGEQRWAALGRASGPLRVDDRLEADGVALRISAKDEEGGLSVEVFGELEAALERSGQMPIPPYFRREADDDDVERYQTVFAKELGSSAAPTAGLHLTEASLAELRRRAVDIGTLVLHVGIGTFRPVSVDDLNEHPMHEESYEISEELVEAVSATKARGGRVVAVGTTVVRALESSARDGGKLRAGAARTRLLIQPGFQFQVVDALLTNFHQPKSTLLALVSAFAGRERVLSAYRDAVAGGYRFLSYGDAMWLPRRYS
jgi:S-adenosylmethionine:tRNA ribosyltransferase-isomerase